MSTRLPPVPLPQPDLKWWNGMVDTVNDAYAGVTTTAARPPNVVIGFHLFDTTLGRPIWVKSVNPVVWVDATGAIV